MDKRIRIGVDVGGTFTDFVLVDEHRDLIYTGKRLTTPGDPSVAITAGIERLLPLAGTSIDALHSVVHGTTLVANTLIERTGARVGLITTRGFRDALEMGREIPVPNLELNFGGQPTVQGDACKGTRPVWFAETGVTPCPVLSRYALSAGASFEGPAVIEERESTTVVGPGARVTVDKHLTLIIDLEEPR